MMIDIVAPLVALCIDINSGFIMYRTGYALRCHYMLYE